MDSSSVKTVVYVLMVLAVGLLLGVAVLKLGRAAQNPAQVDTRTQAEKLQALEKSPGMKTPAARNFIQNERERLDATREAERAVADQ